MIYITIGIILTVLGIAFTGYGRFTQNKETKESQKELISLSNQNAELTKKLIDTSEDRFRKLTKPEINVIGIVENNKGVDSYLVIKAKNTGGNDCFDAKLIIDRHNSPLGKNFAIQSIAKFPKDTLVDYKIPLFQPMVIAKIVEPNDADIKEFKNNFLKRYQNNEKAIVIFYHFEYKWNDETLKSSQFLIVKSNNEKPYFSSIEKYVDKN